MKVIRLARSSEAEQCPLIARIRPSGPSRTLQSVVPSNGGPKTAHPDPRIYYPHALPVYSGTVSRLAEHPPGRCRYLQFHLARSVCTCDETQVYDPGEIILSQHDERHSGCKSPGFVSRHLAQAASSMYGKREQLLLRQQRPVLFRLWNLLYPICGSVVLYHQWRSRDQNLLSSGYWTDNRTPRLLRYVAILQG